MNSPPGLGDSYFKSSRPDPLSHSPISSPSRTNKSYEQPYINGEVLLEEIPAPFTRPASSLDQSKRTTANTSKLGSPQPRRWRLIPASCTCPVHGSSQDYGTGSASASFMSEDLHNEFSKHDSSRHRFTSTRGRILDEELDRLKGTVYQLESDVHSKFPRRSSPGKTFRTSTIRERTEIESTRKELESELKGWQVKLLDQMEGLKKRLDHETSQRSAKEHDLAYKNNQCERLQRQLDDATQRLHTAEDRIVELTASKNKAKERLREVMEEHEYSFNRSMDNSKVADDMRRILEHEMEVRVRVENELQNLQKLVERGMSDSVESRKALDAKIRELEEARSTNARLEREIYSLKSSVGQDKLHFNSEIERAEFDSQQLRDQLSLVTTQLEREREAHAEQMREKIQELNNLQHELQRLQKRISELEAQLQKSTTKHRHSDGEAEQQRGKIIELEGIKARLENEISQLHNRMRLVDKDRERMVAAIHDLQSQVDALQSKSDANAHSGDQETTRLVLVIRDLEAQVEELNKRVAEEREQSSKLASEVDETNSALDEVRLGLEKEMELRKEAEEEYQMVQKMYNEEVSQWRAKETEWERERASLRENGWDDQDKFDRLQADIERLEEEEQERNKEVEERDTLIESLREQLAKVSMNGGTDDRTFEEKMRMEVEGFQEQIKDLCIQLEESSQKLEKESKARADAEAGKKRLEKALLELNAKLQATPTKARDTDAQIASLKDKIAQLEDELERSRASAREALSDFEFDPEHDSDIDETGEHVRVKLSDIQRVLKKLHQIVHDHQFTHKYTREVETHETEETAGDEEVVEDEEEGVVEEEQEKLPNGYHEEEREEEEREEETVEEREEEEEELEAPATPNGAKHVHFGTPSPPATPPNKETTPPRTPPTAAQSAPLTPTTPPTHSHPSPTTPPHSHPSPTTSPTTPSRSLLPKSEAEHDRLASEWKRHVMSSANKYTHSRVPLSSTKRLYPETPTRTASPTKIVERDSMKTKIQNLRKSVSDPSVPQTPPQTPPHHAGQAPGFYYVPVPSDEIDEKLSKVVGETDSTNLSDIPKNFSRLDKGVYQFGTKKIHMQIRDGDLVVRVGGGFMLFVEYLAKHAKVENVKFQRSGMSFTKKPESVSKPLKKKTRPENSQNITTPSKWEHLLDEDTN